MRWQSAITERAEGSERVDANAGVGIIHRASDDIGQRSRREAGGIRVGAGQPRRQRRARRDSVPDRRHQPVPGRRRPEPGQRVGRA